jgi:hypothetical protein
VIGNKGAFDVENVELALVGEGATTAPRPLSATPCP